MTLPARSLGILRRLRGFILVPIFLVAALTAALGDWRSQPFDSVLVGVCPGLTCGGTTTYSWSPYDTCTQVFTGPTLVYGNNPETWKNSLWSLNNVFQDHVILAQGSIGAPYGLVGFHYQNSLDTTSGANGTQATLFVAVDSTTTNVGVPVAQGVDIENDPVYAGSQATASFLQQWVTTVGGRPQSITRMNVRPMQLLEPAVAATIVPKLIYTSRVIGNGQVISGELALPVSSGSATVYILACSTNCFGTYYFPANLDLSTRARGQFAGAQFDVLYNHIQAYLTGGGFAFEALNNSTGCTPDLVGIDPLASPSPAAVTLIGDYAVPISIHGYGSTLASQRFGLNPRGASTNSIFIGAAWAQQVIDPGQPAYTPVQPAAYVLPTPPGAVSTNSDSISLGYDNYGSGHAFTYILPGGNSAPEWIWDYVATPCPFC